MTQSSQPSVAGQVALVTGASSGIGRACALALGQAGAHVVVNHLPEQTDAADTVVAEIEGRIGEPADIAQAVVWLTPYAADYITGTTLVVNGGMMLYPAFRDNG